MDLCFASAFTVQFGPDGKPSSFQGERLLDVGAGPDSPRFTDGFGFNIAAGDDGFLTKTPLSNSRKAPIYAAHRKRVHLTLCYSQELSAKFRC
jgi:hypothetical protein